MKKTRKIVSSIVALCMICNTAAQSIPAALLAANAEEETTATGTVLFEPQNTDVTLGENTASNACGEKTIWTYDMDSHTLVISGKGEAVSMTYTSDSFLDYINAVETVIVQGDVSSLNENLFEGFESVTKLVLPYAGTNADGTASIPNLSYLFGDTSCALTSLTINGGIEVPNEFCSSRCSLMTELVLADSIRTIGNNAFYSCSSLTELHLPASLNAIGQYAFCDARALTTLEIPEGTETIGKSAFSYCGALTDITIPDSVKKMGANVFMYTAVEHIKMPADIQLFNADSDTEFSEESSEAFVLQTLFGSSYDQKPENLSKVEITSGTTIPDGFFYAFNIAEVTLPDTITSIGERAFSNCPSLTGIVLPDSLLTIGNEAFYNCDSLQAIEIPASVTSIGNHAFGNCPELETLTLNKGLKTIGEYAFSGCAKLADITLPSTLTTIGNYAFSDDNSLTALIVPDSVEEIGSHFLYNCNSLKSLTLPFAGKTATDTDCSLNTFFGDYFNNSLSLDSLTITGGTQVPANFAYGYQSLTSVKLADSITTVGEYAFHSCSSLASITMPADLVRVGKEAFTETAWYEALNNGVVYAGKTAVGYKGKIPSNFKLTLRSGTLGIADDAFNNQNDIISVTLPDTLESIGQYAFYSCNGLTSVTIPDSVNYLGDYAFADCSKLAKVTLSSGISHIGTTPFRNTAYDEATADGPVYIGKVFVGYKGEMPRKTSLVLKEGTTEISDNALKDYANLVSITIPDTVTSIGDSAFQGCSGLKSVAIPESVTSLGSYAFDGCTSLQSVKLSPAITTIRDSLFHNCEALQEIVIPDGVTSIEGYAFNNCFALTRITMPDSVKFVGDWAFDLNYNKDYAPTERTLIIADGSSTVTSEMTHGLQDSLFAVQLPDSLTSIGNGAFDNMKNLSEITIPENVTAIHEYAFNRCTGLTTVTIPAKVKTIGANAFSECSAVAEINFAGNPTSIGESAFEQCQALTSVTLPDSITQIGNGAFNECTSLAEITLPASLKAVPDYMLYRCAALQEITIPTGTEKIGNHAFGMCAGLKKITLPDTLTDVSGYAYDGNSERPEEQSFLTLEVAKGSKTVNYTMTNGLEDYADKVILPAGVTVIEDAAFSSFMHLTDINFPSSLTKIGNDAFSNCQLLRTVKLPEKLTTLGENAFSDCYSLNTIEIPSTITAIPHGAFNQCKSLVNLTLPDTLISIGSNAFADCNSLTAIAFPKNLETIESYAFYNCSQLDTITLPVSIINIDESAFDNPYLNDSDILNYRTIVLAEGTDTVYRNSIQAFRRSAVQVILPSTVTEIEDDAFANFIRLTSIQLPDALETIGVDAFRNCSALSTLELPDSITRIPQGICENCSSLESVKLPANVNRITDRAFRNCKSLTSVISDEQNFSFRASSFDGCLSLYDPRFMILDKRNINFSANTNKMTVDGLVNFSLTYQLTSFMFEDGAQPELVLNIPEGLTLLGNLEYEQDYYNNYHIPISNLKDVMNFSCRVNSYGSYDVTASLRFSYDNETWEEPIGTVEIQSPTVTISAPQSINTNTVKVSGFAKPGETVSIFADDGKVAEVTANEKTGRYTADLILLTKESNESYSIYAMVGDQQTDVIHVVYTPEKPIIEEVTLYYNNHEDTKTDITPIFTEGKRPVISYNPAYPFRFEIKASKPQHISRLYITSTKGSDVKRLEARWDAKRGVWVAYGYFDPNNHSYVPGTLNIQMLESHPVAVNAQAKTITTDSDVMKELYPRTDSSTWSNKLADIPTDILPENVKNNATADVVFAKGSAVVADVRLSNGADRQDLTYYVDASDTIYDGGVQYTIAQVSSNPEAYGFTKSDVFSVDEDGVQYVYYTRSPRSSDVALQVFDTLEAGGVLKTSDKTFTVGNIYSWRNATGMQTLCLKASDNSPVRFTTAAATVKDSMSALLDVNDTKTVKALVNEHLLEMEPIFRQITSKEDVVKAARSYNYRFSQSKNLTIYDSVQKGLDILQTGTMLSDSLNQLRRITNNAAMLDQAYGYTAAYIGYTLLHSELTDESIPLTSKKMASYLDPALSPGVETAIADTNGILMGRLLTLRSVEDILRVWYITYEPRYNYYFIWDGYITVLIDPSGFVYEAVESNRIADATVTIYYKDPETGEEVEWIADDYDQKNPLVTNADGEYAWDVPEGQWRVKCEKDGYETMYTDWMDVPPIQTGVNIGMVRQEAAKIDSAVMLDDCIEVTFNQYMDAASVKDSTLSVTSGNKQVDVTVTPVLSEQSDKYTNTFRLTGTFPTGKLTITASGVKSYTGTAANSSTTVTVPESIVSLTTDNTNLYVLTNEPTVFEIKAEPASKAAGKQLLINGATTYTDAAAHAEITASTFDKNGIANLTVTQQSTTIGEPLVLSVDGSELTLSVNVVAADTQDALDSWRASLERTAPAAEEPAYTVGDVNDDGSIDLKDVALLRRYYAGGWNVEINTKAADVNNDGSIDLKDVALLRRYYAGGWNVTLG